jgi:hypothetical protein
VPSPTEVSGPISPPTITVNTSPSTQYHITVNANGGAVTID